MKSLLAVVLGSAFALFVAEGLVRLVGAPEVAPLRRGRLQLSANPRLVFEPVPSMLVEDTPSNFREYRGLSNSLGYRDREHAVAKPDGVYRIVVLGDSIAAGYGIERQEDVFHEVLGRQLESAGRRVEILNFGVTGYNTEQEVETLRARALAFAPDLVLLAYCLNDRRPPDPRLVRALREVAPKGGMVPPSAGGELLVRSALYRFLRYAVFDREPAEEAAEGTSGDTTEASLRELAELARGGGFAVLLADFPGLPEFNSRADAPEHERLRRLSEELAFHYLDLRPAFRDCRKAQRKKMGFDHYHPTPRGHDCAGRALASTVEDLIGLPPAPATG